MILKKLDWLIIGEDKENALTQRVFNTYCLLGLLIYTYNDFLDYYTQVDWQVRTITLSFTLVFFLIYYFSRFKGKYKQLPPVFLFVSLLNLSISWFFLDGVDGGLSVIFVLISISMVVTFPTKYILVVPTIVLLNYAVLVFINFNYPHLIQDQYPSDVEKRIDSISLTMTSILIGSIIVLVFKKAYERERAALKNKNLELINTQEELQRYTENLSVINIQLEEAKLEAERLHKQKSDFLTTISHEIRTPLNSVIGMSKLLNMDTADPQERKNLEVLQFSANNLLTLVNDVLDFSKIEAGKIELEKVDVNISRLLHSIGNQFTHLLKEKSIQLFINIDEAIPEVVKLDDARFKQVMYNLISNALKFTEEGKVEVSARLITINEQSCSVFFEVKDTGIGISEEKQQLIFKAFEQESISINRKYGGTGLGLSITKELITLMGGEIQLESKENTGARFYFSLDLEIGDRVEEEVSPIKEVKSQIDLSFLNILVVDDNEMNLQLAEAIFRKWNVKIDTADSGRVALEKVKNAEYDFILLDLQMPEMDGYQVASEIIFNEKDKLDKTPIIALTASVQKEVKEKALSIGMTDFLSKPFSHEDLRDMIFKYTKVK